MRTLHDGRSILIKEFKKFLGAKKKNGLYYINEKTYNEEQFFQLAHRIVERLFFMNK